MQQCRGLIVDEADDWAIVSHPFDKFFNAGEAGASEIDWHSARVYEKLDGSLMSLYFYDGAWQVASSGVPDAGGPFGTRSGFTMAQGFWEIWRDLGLDLPTQDFAGWWFGFEMMTPWNKIIVPHETSKLVCIGARAANGREVRSESLDFDWPTVVSYPLQTLDDVLAAAENIHPTQGEGFVVCDDCFRRVKIKSPQYVALHHLRDQLSIPRMLDLVRQGEGEEFLAYFPDFGMQFQQIQKRYDALVAQIESDYREIENIAEQRDFAEAAKTRRLPGALFALRKGKVANAREFLSGAPLSTLIAWLGLREEINDEA